MIRDLKSGQLLTARQLAERLATAAYVLVGEQRNNPDHPALQLWLLQALGDRRPQGSLLLEMLTPIQQARVDEIRASVRTFREPVDLRASLEWHPQWNWDVYGPVLRFAFAQSWPLLSAGPDFPDLESGLQDIARRLLDAPVPALLFADAARLRGSVGIAQRLSDLGEDGQVVVLRLACKGEHVEPDSADFVWYTAAIS